MLIFKLGKEATIMIDVSMVQDGFNPTIIECVELEHYLDQIVSATDSLVRSFYTENESLLLEKEILGSLDEAKETVLTEGSKNIIKKIGDSILAMIKKFREFLTKIKEKFSGIFIKGESETKKLERLIKDHPEFKDEVIASFKSGELDLKDVNSFKELNRAYEEIMKASNDEKTDPNSLKAKWKKAVEKFENSNKALIPAVTGAVTLSVLIFTYRSKLKKAKADTLAEGEKIEQATYKMYQKLMDQGTIDANTPVLQAKLAINREFLGKSNAAMGQNLNVLNRITNSLVRAGDRLLGSRAGRAITGGSTEKFHLNQRQTGIKIQRAQEEDSRKAEREEYAKQSARFKFNQDHEDEIRKQKKRELKTAEKVKLKVRKKYDDDNRQEYLRRLEEDEARKTTSRMNADASYRRSHRADIDADDRRTASNQAYGKNEGDTRYYNDHRADVHRRKENEAAVQQAGRNRANRRNQNNP